MLGKRRERLAKEECTLYNNIVHCSNTSLLKYCGVERYQIHLRRELKKTRELQRERKREREEGNRISSPSLKRSQRNEQDQRE